MIFKNTSSGDLNGFLDVGSRCVGELHFENTMRIDGTFRGKIVSANELIVGESADIDAEISVGRISINGAVKGRVVATERVEIHARARAVCDIETPVLIVEEGAVFEGSCRMPVAGGKVENLEDSASRIRAVKKG